MYILWCNLLRKWAQRSTIRMHTHLKPNWLQYPKPFWEKTIKSECEFFLSYVNICWWNFCWFFTIFAVRNKQVLRFERMQVKLSAAAVGNYDRQTTIQPTDRPTDKQTEKTGSWGSFTLKFIVEWRTLWSTLLITDLTSYLTFEYLVIWDVCLFLL